MQAGRPTKLTPETLEKAKHYIEGCIDTPIETEKGVLSYVEVNLPSVVGLARYLDVDKTTIYEWCKGNQELSSEFSPIVKQVEQEQEKRLINKSLGGLYQPKIAGMLLGKHGYYEKQEIDLRKAEEPTDDELRDAIASGTRSGQTPSVSA